MISAEPLLGISSGELSRICLCGILPYLLPGSLLDVFIVLSGISLISLYGISSRTFSRDILRTASEVSVKNPPVQLKVSGQFHLDFF